MRLLFPAALIFSLLAIPILLLYMLKLRRPEVLVSSTLLWERLLRDRQANAPWQRIKRNLLLLLQLLILAALVVALARPALPTPSLVSGSVVVLLDGSASMQATDVAPSRFEAARQAVHDLIDRLPGSARMTIILAGLQAQTLIAATSDRLSLHEALDQAEASQGASDWQAAFALAASAAVAAQGDPSQAGEQPDIVLVSDGGLPEEGLPGLPGQVQFLQVGGKEDNLAITALALRPAREGIELFARATNYGAASRKAILSLYADERLFEARKVDLPPGESTSLVIADLPEKAALFRAQLSNPDGENERLDFLPLDDAAFAISPESRSHRVLLATPGNLFLEQVLAALPGLDPFRVLPQENGSLVIPQEAGASEPVDLYVLDGLVPDPLPPGNLLLINPPDNPLFEVGGYFTTTFPIRAGEHPLTRFVDWENVNILRARLVKTPDWADTAASAPGGPLVLAGEVGGRRVAAITFDLHESDLPLQVAFPILLSNLVNYLLDAPNLGNLTGGDSLYPGQCLQIPPGVDSQRWIIHTPGGETIPVEAGESSANFTKTEELGIYRIFAEGESMPAGQFVVNLFDPLESNIRPVTTVMLGRTPVSASRQTEMGQREIWPFLAGLALAVLMLEWWVYHRGTAIPVRTPLAIRRPPFFRR